jgi:phenylalanyl-tRNA synthetase alpha chain
MKLPDADKLLAELKEKIKSAINETQIIEIKNSFTNKYLASIYEELKYATIQDKKTIGNYLNLLKKQINTIINDTIRDIQTETENKLHLVDYDITINPTAVNPGGLTLTSLIVRDAMIYFNKMGFDIISGSEIVDVKYNFSNLNIDINHPARNASDSFFINISTMLRTQCTAVSAQILEDNTKEDIRVVTFGNVYRNDDDDATHSHQFSQIDIVWLKKDLSIKNLK